MFNVNNKNTRTTSFNFVLHLTPFFTVSTLDYEQVNVSSEFNNKDREKHP